MNKCKNCEWYNKPYWSIINPCDNCPRENDGVVIISRWQDPTIDELRNALIKAETDNLYLNDENKYLKSIIKEVKEYVRSNEWAKDYEISSCRTHLLEILDKENKDE